MDQCGGARSRVHYLAGCRRICGNENCSHDLEFAASEPWRVTVKTGESYDFSFILRQEVSPLRDTLCEDLGFRVEISLAFHLRKD